jgi:6-phosphofructokinase
LVCSVRECSLGHLCQGLYPSPLDRVRSARLAAFAVHEILDEVAKGGQPSCATVGFKDGRIIKTEVDILAKACAQYASLAVGL